MKIAVLMVLPLAGCVLTPVTYTEPITHEFKVVVKEHTDWRVRCGDSYPGYARGCTYRNLATKTCTIIVPRFTHVDDRAVLTVWGEEILHCVYGKYHEGPFTSYRYTKRIKGRLARPAAHP